MDTGRFAINRLVLQEKQQLQSDLIQSQARIHELERMLSNNDQVRAKKRKISVINQY